MDAAIYGDTSTMWRHRPTTQHTLIHTQGLDCAFLAHDSHTHTHTYSLGFLLLATTQLVVVVVFSLSLKLLLPPRWWWCCCDDVLLCLVGVVRMVVVWLYWLQMLMSLSSSCWMLLVLSLPCASVSQHARLMLFASTMFFTFFSFDDSLFPPSIEWNTHTQDFASSRRTSFL